MEKLKKSQFFIIDNTTGKPVATANAWWKEVDHQVVRVALILH